MPHPIRQLDLWLKRRDRRYRHPGTTIWSRVKLALPSRLLWTLGSALLAILIPSVLRSREIAPGQVILTLGFSMSLMLGFLAFPVAGWGVRLKHHSQGDPRTRACCPRCRHPRASERSVTCTECGRDLSSRYAVVWRSPPLEHASVPGGITLVACAVLAGPSVVLLGMLW